MEKYDITVYGNQIEKKEFQEIIEELFHDVPDNIMIKKDSRGFLDNIQPIVQIAIISGGFSILNAFITGLFLLWSKNCESKNRTPNLTIKTKRKTIIIKTRKDIPKRKKNYDEEIIEIQLKFENNK